MKRSTTTVLSLAGLALVLAACAPSIDDDTAQALNGNACTWVDAVADQANMSMISADPTALVVAGDHLRDGISLPDGELKDAIAAAGQAAPALEDEVHILPEDLDLFNDNLDAISTICVDLGQDAISTRVEYPDSDSVVEVLDGSYGG